MEELTETMNKILEEKASISRVLNPQRAKSYSLNISIKIEDRPGEEGISPPGFIIYLCYVKSMLNVS